MSTRDELANLIDDAAEWATSQGRICSPHEVADAILAAGYIKADREEWGVQSPFGNIRPCSNEGIARLLTTNWSTVRRLVGPWEAA